MTKAFVFDAYGTLFDVQSVADATEAAFPGHGDIITQIWRMKQLEYSWLRSLMGAYEDFWAVTRQSLAYTLGVLGLEASPALIDEIAETYNSLTPYPEAEAALAALSAYPRAILSNGSPAMLDALVGRSPLAPHIGAILSVDAAGAFKPDPRAYALVEARLGVKPADVVFVSANGFDIAGAKRFGFRVARIARVPAAAVRAEIGKAAQAGLLPPATFYKALRTQLEGLGFAPDFEVASLSELARLPGIAPAAH
ncbi:haloacid dehalogenase type II [Xanthobacter tagetidis]|jgi:2-haloacid dehalogenase|uniref:(S)-2-haloacid dehalogenase n=1 Tax=Xanthobacter tagetidis TaxID=60216 RepID=A0A3L7A8I6_9HYPH|nr:haloacid dehalogenase type II [Xanthobacter tagetidis]MBB6307358.1 2-haloacid dehalogenase [Xanthobacter tagetidis]RLP75891.1 haloacid dehalogenase type II [Xanthobacter tagetidis]